MNSMCIGDWRAGRLIRTTRRQVTLLTGQSTSVLANRQRVGITIAQAGAKIADAASVTITVGGVSIDALRANEGTKHYSMLTHGELPTLDFVISVTGATLIIGIVEYTMPESYLNAMLGEFSRLYR